MLRAKVVGPLAKIAFDPNTVLATGKNWRIASRVFYDLLKQKGNFNIGSATHSQAKELGMTWVGKGYKVASDGRTLVSRDGLKQYRPPSEKPRSNFAKTGTQANFEHKPSRNGAWVGNGHLDILD